MCINMVGNVHVLFWFVNVKFQGLYDLLVIDWVSDRFGLQTAKGKKKLTGKNRDESDRKLGQILAGLSWKF